MRPNDQPNTTAESVPQQRPFPSKWRIAGLLIIGLVVLIIWFLGVAYFGWQRGEALREESETQAITEQIARQKELAAGNINEGNYELALLRLDWVIEQDAGDQAALALKSDAENGLLVLFTPTPTAVATAVPTSTPLPTPTVGPISSPNDELQRIRRLVATKEWQAAVSAITKFQLEFPSYERQETDTYLYDAYLEIAVDMLNGDDVEAGMYYLDLAATLGDLSQTMIDYETWAELYLQGVAFYGANWDASAYYFRDLCLAAPFYQNSCTRLQEVLISYGDDRASVQEWCPALDLYTEANRYDFVPDLNQKLETAQEMCALATPTPEIPTPELTVTADAVDSFGFETPVPTTGP
ncbi:MAG: hypothetical protein AAF490_08585 [Chloroflexota bacterium]